MFIIPCRLNYAIYVVIMVWPKQLMRNDLPLAILSLILVFVFFLYFSGITTFLLRKLINTKKIRQVVYVFTYLFEFAYFCREA